MQTELRFLNNYPAEKIHETILEAFSDYQLDMSYMTLERFVRRAKLGRVDFSCSVGAFSENKLVGFTSIGIDYYKGGYSAFDAGTGIIKEFRGMGIAGKMFDFAIPKLKEKGVQKFYLEVLQDNKPAIRAYEKTGFKIEREYFCYKTEIDKIKNTNIKIPDVKIKAIPQNEVKNFTHLFLQEISWESNLDAIEHASEDIINLAAFEEEKCVGIISFYPTLEWILVFGVEIEQREKGIDTLLFESMVEKVKGSVQLIKMGNLVPENPLNKFFFDKGFELYAKQYEMVCDL
ncbi:MAG: GNAT family N-acetyltransferase [Prolixibacteraceae bacterium]|nr:GNAT family N-acetyltransferase [Prolixibacteraceae bacterium]